MRLRNRRVVMVLLALLLASASLFAFVTGAAADHVLGASYNTWYYATPPGGSEIQFNLSYLADVSYDYYSGGYYTYEPSNGYHAYESVLVIQNPQDVAWMSTSLDINWNNTYEYTVSSFNSCCYYLQPGAMMYGGNSDSPQNSYGSSASSYIVDHSAIENCDSGGCYGGDTGSDTWTAWY